MSVFGRRAAIAQQVQIERDESDRALTAAETERVRLRTALDALSVGVVLADRHGTLQVRNRAAGAFAGHEAVLVSAAVERLLRLASSGTRGQESVSFFGPPKRVLSLNATPLAEGFALATIDDVSERARLDSVRTDFVANISHELKTPVGALAVLAEAAADSDDPVVTRRLVSKMVEEAHRAARTIDDLLELSRIELGGQAIQEVVDVHQVMIDAIERARIVADQRSITLVLSEPSADQQGGGGGGGSKALGDIRQLVSAVTNLIDNAVKYSDAGSEVVIASTANGAWVDVSITDHGVGIPARDLDRIFERFYRVDQARSRSTGGTGLGLAIVRHVATNHGGDVLVTSREGVGSRFILRLPAAHDGGTSNHGNES